MGRINGWTLHNDVLVAQDQCLADSKNIVTEADLLAYILERQKALRVQAAAEHIERKAWALIGRKPG
jgi:hypothetical protein